MTTPEKEQREYYYQVDQLVSVNAYFEAQIGNELVKFQVTSRYSASPEKIAATTESAIKAYELLREKFPLPERKPATIAEQPNAQGNGNSEKKTYTQTPVPTNLLPEGLPEGEYFADEFDYFVVEPQPDEKATVKFYKDNLKFPVGANINKWKNAFVKQALSALVENFDPAKAEKYRVAGKQFWTKGNEYTIASGTHAGEKSHYKDFRAVEMTF